MNQPAKAHEPSMEEILASIRRIIADDDIPKAPAAGACVARTVAAGSPGHGCAAAREPEPVFEAPLEFRRRMQRFER